MVVRWGICCAGKISHDFTVALKTLPPEEHQVVAVAARDLKRAEEFAKKHCIPKAYGGYEELAKDPEIGVDESMVIMLKFSRERLAVCTCTIAVNLPNQAAIFGTKGTIQVPAHMWSPTSLIVNGKEAHYPVPEPCLPLNYKNSTGLRYEAEEVRQCLLKGLKESPRMSHSDSTLLTEIMDECRRQVGVVYSQDLQ
ncbi:trans-1,2-dihydrobenzene-1,2-diol dehydrogenase-like [Neoarius graeffei]|uniref:trans-1,2-dihydrobenzene-1,2-diol dehydrogenase-like n=1 Tax=Neoarius graeffei TaxID=443677 RepID=UPI00298D4F25|nr:trans-1,2-dihydrobenzene-1,2-diol dehydrogenase-like [Neoarius graeffei]